MQQFPASDTPPNLPYIIIVQTCGKRWDLPKFVDVLSVNLGFSQSLTIFLTFQTRLQVAGASCRELPALNEELRCVLLFLNWMLMHAFSEFIPYINNQQNRHANQDEMKIMPCNFIQTHQESSFRYQ